MTKKRKPKLRDHVITILVGIALIVGPVVACVFYLPAAWTAPEIAEGRGGKGTTAGGLLCCVLVIPVVGVFRIRTGIQGLRSMEK